MAQTNARTSVVRGAVVGLVVGLAVAAIHADAAAQDHEFGTELYYLAMLAVPFPLGGGAARLLRMSRWGVVSIIGAIATLLLGTAVWRVVPENTLFGVDDPRAGGVWVLAGLIGYLAATWWARETGGWWGRITIAGLLVTAQVATLQVEEPLRRSREVSAFERAGVPLVAPEVAGHTLNRAEVWSGDQEEGGSAILLEYERGRGDAYDSTWSQVRVFVRPVSAATPEAACATPYPLLMWGTEGGPCRSAGGGRWVRQDPDGVTAVFARHGNALVQLDSGSASEADLLAVLRTVRPVLAVTLANV
ncbi:hypothetical protein [Nonomuraea africana]|uniref:hypothetical protein n=1 Tax=Nonomuraea africana TaxID=46171 RepID=UPI0033DF44AF